MMRSSCSDRLKLICSILWNRQRNRMRRRCQNKLPYSSHQLTGGTFRRPDRLSSLQAPPRGKQVMPKGYLLLFLLLCIQPALAGERLEPAMEAFAAIEADPIKLQSYCEIMQARAAMAVGDVAVDSK